MPSFVWGSRDTEMKRAQTDVVTGVRGGKGSHHREECSPDKLGQAEARGLEGPGDHWRVQSHKEVRPAEALLSSPNSELCFSVMGDLRLLGEPNCPRVRTQLCPAGPAGSLSCVLLSCRLRCRPESVSRPPAELAPKPIHPNSFLL